MLFVVKANAYGHGAAACAKAVTSAGLAECLGVSSVEEGASLRSQGVRGPILILGSLYPFESFLAAAEFRLTPTVASLESAHRLAEAARRIGRRVACHLKIETGLNRIGVRGPEGLKVAEYVAGEKLLKLEGAYTHLSCASSDPEYTRLQLDLFTDFLSALKRAKISLEFRHAANSAAALGYRSARLDMVRPGLALYGLCPGFEPVLSLKSKVVFIKNVAKGSSVGYGATFRARRNTRLATIPAGYADGLPRGLSNLGDVLIGGMRCKIAGQISMDMATVDVTDVPAARVGSEVVLIGRQGSQSITVVEISKRVGCIPYEVTCGLSSRVPRVYSGAVRR